MAVATASAALTREARLGTNANARFESGLIGEPTSATSPKTGAPDKKDLESSELRAIGVKHSLAA
jgi:hypothetical protein